jgi:large subunit ribosomal protein L6
MSKIAKIPVLIKEGVTVNISERSVSVNGPKGTLTFEIPQGVGAKIEDGKILVSQEDIESNALSGLTRAIIANMVKGVTEGFERKLELSGVGYRAQAAGDTLTLSLGFSHPIVVKAEAGITLGVSENIITVSGIDKALVGNTAAKIRSIRPPEPYKGKGIKFENERIRRKAGKAAKTVGAAGAK